MADPITELPPAPSRQDPINFSDDADALLGALDQFVEETNAVAVAMNLNDTNDVSTSSVAIGLGSKTFTVTAAKSFLPGMFLAIADDAAPSTNSMFGQITSYSGTTLIVEVSLIYGSGTKSAWTISQSSPVSDIQTNNKNIIINGNFNIWQRGTSFTGTSPYYSADRWQAYRAGGAAGATFSRVANSTSTGAYYMKMQRDVSGSALNNLSLATSFETINNYSLLGKDVSLSFNLIKGANFSGASVNIDVLYGTGTDGSIVNGFTGQASAISINVLAASITTGLTKFSVSGTVPANATQLGVLVSWTPIGTAGAEDWVGISQVQLEKGLAATAFEYRSYGEELTLCQRYYAAITTWSYDGYAAAAGQFGYTVVSFGVNMRAIPTIYIGTAGGGSTNNGGAFAVDQTKAGCTMRIQSSAAGRMYHLTAQGAYAESEL